MKKMDVNGNNNDMGFSNLSNQNEDNDLMQVIKYVTQMLMEEDTCMIHESLALQTAEKSLYDVIGERYPPSISPINDPSGFVDRILKTPDGIRAGNCGDSDDVICTNSGGFSRNCGLNATDFRPSSSDSCGLDGFVDQILRIPDEIQGGYCCNSDNIICTTSSDFSKNRELYATDFHLSSSNICGTTSLDGFVDHILNIPDEIHAGNCSNSDNIIRTTSSDLSSNCASNNWATTTSLDGLVDSPVSTLRVPDTLFGNSDYDSLLLKGKMVEVESKTKTIKTGKKNRHVESVDLENGRSSKQSAISTETVMKPEIFDLVLLHNEGKSESALRESMTLKGSNGGKGRVKKKGGKKDCVDLRTLLTLCAQAVSNSNQRTAYELLKQIKQHSSPIGDGIQRTAHYFANGLEARLAGSGRDIHTTLLGLRTPASNILKAYHLLLSVCPFKKLSILFSNKTIMQVAKNAKKLHIIDFGIVYGFQWPCLIQRLSSRPGGPPMLKITGIDFPQPGLRPAERAEETGQRLSSYAKTFNVPFEFKVILQKWETIKIEDIKIKDDEVVVVNCMYRFRHLFDESMMAESPRNIVLNLIKKMKPETFIQGVVNAAYGAPFFITRFRDALFHFSTLFDMLDANAPRDCQERMLLEKQIFGHEAINVIACEGGERIERPETYKQWHVRNVRAGFVPLPLNREIMKMATEIKKNCYHKDFMIDEDGEWMLQGWKGRITFALSSWKPA